MAGKATSNNSLTRSTPIKGSLPFKIEPQPHETAIGIIRVRGIPLTPAAKFLETLVQRNLGHLNGSTNLPG